MRKGYIKTIARDVQLIHGPSRCGDDITCRGRLLRGRLQRCHRCEQPGTGMLKRGH